MATALFPVDAMTGQDNLFKDEQRKISFEIPHGYAKKQIEELPKTSVENMNIKSSDRQRIQNAAKEFQARPTANLVWTRQSADPQQSTTIRVNFNSPGKFGEAKALEIMKKRLEADQKQLQTYHSILAPETVEKAL